MKLRRGLIAVGSAGGLTAVAMLMMLAPAASAATPHTPVVLKAPYSGTALTTYNNWNVGGCATAKIVKMATWSATTGKGVMADKAGAVTCGGTTIGSVGGSSSGGAGGEFQVGIPIPIAKTGKGHVVEHWNAKAVVAGTLVTGTCASSGATYWSCYQAGDAYVYAYSYLIDMTNGSYFYSSNYWGGITNDTYNDSYCYSGSCYNYSGAYTYGHSGPVAFYFNGTFDSTHSYAIVTYWYGGAYADLSAYNTAISGGSAVASMNMGTLGNGATLNWIKIS